MAKHELNVKEMSANELLHKLEFYFDFDSRDREARDAIIEELKDRLLTLESLQKKSSSKRERRTQMKEILIRIPDEAHNLLTGKSDVENIDLYSTLIQAVQSGILIPDNATNGDVIKAIFGGMQINDPENENDLVYIEHLYFGFPKYWWDAPFNRSKVELREDVKGLLGNSFFNR